MIFVFKKIPSIVLKATLIVSYITLLGLGVFPFTFATLQALQSSSKVRGAYSYLLLTF